MELPVAVGNKLPKLHRWGYRLRLSDPCDERWHNFPIFNLCLLEKLCHQLMCKDCYGQMVSPSSVSPEVELFPSAVPGCYDGNNPYPGTVDGRWLARSSTVNFKYELTSHQQSLGWRFVREKYLLETNDLQPITVVSYRLLHINLTYASISVSIPIGNFSSAFGNYSNNNTSIIVARKQESWK